MDVKEVSVKAIKPYELNAKIHTDEQVETIANSIKEFGWKQPIVIDKDGVVIVGHGRLQAAKRLGLKKVPCVIADDLTEDKIRAYRIADNKANESEWNFAALEKELSEISIDMSMFGLEFYSAEDETEDTEEDDGGWYGDERERTNRAYNLGIIDYGNMTDDFWQMPIIRNENYIPDELIGFNYAKSNKRKDVGIHFYIDDYQFERIWSYPEKYVDILAQYDCILSPDFSLYMDMPMAMKIWNIYRSRQIGAYYQSQGIKVIPTISWAEEETYEFCFRRIPEGSVVSVSTVGVKRDSEAMQVWESGMKAMIERIRPTTILVYGGKLDFNYGDIKTVYYDNAVTEGWKKRESKA